MSLALLHKRLHGQFFTTTNPFNSDLFHKWLKLNPGFTEHTPILEPFAGAGNIVGMVRDMGYDNPWDCYDIQPVNDPDLNATGIKVKERDTLTDFPSGYHLAITNPPYLARNSATRRGLPFPETRRDDLYQHALEVMLDHTPFVAAIIPESFTTQELFHDRLYAVVSLACRMFEDTEEPVCLALFVPEDEAPGEDFMLYSNHRLIGSYRELRQCLHNYVGDGLNLRFNDPEGAIGLHAIDNHKTASIQFVPGECIDGRRVTSSSRSITRISTELDPTAVRRVIERANVILADRRERTHDAFMTAFKGLRKDGRYRRRLDFKQARNLLNLAAHKEGFL